MSAPVLVFTNPARPRRRDKQSLANQSLPAIAAKAAQLYDLDRISAAQVEELLDDLIEGFEGLAS